MWISPIYKFVALLWLVSYAIKSLSLSHTHTQPKDPWDYDSLEERLADATRIKEKGTKYFKDGKFDLASKLYKRGSDLLTDTELRKAEQKEAAKPLRVAFYLNLAACYLKLNDPKEAITQCNDVRDSTL